MTTLDLPQALEMLRETMKSFPFANDVPRSVVCETVGGLQKFAFGDPMMSNDGSENRVQNIASDCKCGGSKKALGEREEHIGRDVPRGMGSEIEIHNPNDARRDESALSLSRSSNAERHFQKHSEINDSTHDAQPETPTKPSQAA